MLSYMFKESRFHPQRVNVEKHRGLSPLVWEDVQIYDLFIRLHFAGVVMCIRKCKVHISCIYRAYVKFQYQKCYIL
jgi:hypothetical protein